MFGRLRYRNTLIAALILAGGIALFAQETSKDLAAKRDELSRLRETIRTSEGKLKRLETRARKSAAAANESRLQADALDSLVGLLEKREGAIAEEMISVRARRDSLDRLRAAMTEEYRNVARALYRQRLLAPSASMLLMPEEHRRLALSERLFQRYAKRQVRIANSIVSLRDSLNRKDSVLTARREEQLALLSDRRSQVEKLHRLETKYSAELKRARSERGTLEELVRRKQAEAQQIEGMITQLIAKAERQAARKEEARKAAATAETKSTRSREEKTAPVESRSQGQASRTTSAKPRNEERAENREPTSSTLPSGTFRASWPVSGREILNGYGERRNPRTNTVTFNPGVNIAATKGTAVKAADAGKVSLVSWLPGYGTVVILEHSGGWRTVYANLAAAAVSEGTSVGRGARIGTVGESVDGEYLHFEVWQGQNRLDPMTKLR